MKYRILASLSAVLFVVSMAAFTSCGQVEKTADDLHGQEASDADHQHASVFQCPMQCEGDKTYAEDGKCPKCGMGLEGVEAHGDHDHDGDHSHDEDHDHGHESGENDHNHDTEDDHDHRIKHDHDHTEE